MNRRDAETPRRRKSLRKRLPEFSVESITLAEAWGGGNLGPLCAMKREFCSRFWESSSLSSSSSRSGPDFENELEDDDDHDGQG
jgi:hypothetical protein